MKKIVIRSDNSTICAVIVPAFGGAIAQLTICDVDVLRMNYASLGISNVLAGGIPILFPFAGKSENDTAIFHDAKYTMPMHGFAKDMPFEPRRIWDSGCELCLKSDGIITKNYYPYDFMLTISYDVTDMQLRTVARIENMSPCAMPVAMGFHPFFNTPDKGMATLEFESREYWDYTHCDGAAAPKHGYREVPVLLSDSYDHVFVSNHGVQMTLVDKTAGYRAQMSCGDTFKVMTICTELENASCIEPWQSVPNSANSGEMVQKIQPGKTACFEYQIELMSLRTR